MRRLFIATLLFSFTGFAQEAPLLKGLVLLGEGVALLESTQLQEVEGVQIIGLSLPGKLDDFASRLDPIYWQKPFSQELAAEIKRAIHAYYEQERDPFILLTIPEQNLSTQVLQLFVIKAKVGRVAVEGTSWSPPQRLRNYLALYPGREVQLLPLECDVSFMNRNPFRRVSILYQKGEEWGTTDITLSVKERKQLRVFGGIENTGFRLTGQERLYAGFSWGKAFGWDHIASFQFLSSYDREQFQAWTGQYLALLSWKHLLNLYGGFSKVHASLPWPSMHNRGKTSQCSLRYTIPLKAFKYIQQEISFGGDYKNLDNTIEFNEFSAEEARYVNLTQFAGSYLAVFEYEKTKIEVCLEAFWSPRKWLDHQTKAAFQSLRSGTSNKWLYGQLDLKWFQHLPRRWSFFLRSLGQISSIALLPSEQVGIGGFGTVRGYETREFNADEALLGSLEVRTPPLSFLSSRKRREYDALQLLLFCDTGWGSNKSHIGDEKRSQLLVGAGPGLRYTLDPFVALRFDWGIRLHRQADFSGEWYKLHFNATLSY